MKKKIFMLTLVITFILTSVSAFAELGYFSFNLHAGEYESSSDVEKSDSEQKAYVRVTDNNFHSGDLMLWRVRKSSDGSIGTESKYYAQTGLFTLNYVNTGIAGDDYYLNGYQDPNTPDPGGFVVSGRWNP